MSRTATFLMAVLVTMIGLPSVCMAKSPAEAKDRTKYEQLIRQIERVDAMYQQAVEKATQQAREDGGDADLETKNQILRFQSKRDRLMDRVLLIALRWGWDVPDFNAGSTQSRSKPVLTDKELVFNSADQVIKAKLSKESRRIARNLTLPVLSVSKNAETQK